MSIVELGDAVTLGNERLVQACVETNPRLLKLKGHRGILEFLIRNLDQWTHTSNKWVQMFELLCNLGADKQNVVGYPEMPHSVLLYGDELIVRYLCSLGFSLEIRTLLSFGETPILVALQNPNTSILLYLLRQGNSDVNEVNVFGVTAIYSALDNGWYDKAELLISFGADPNIGCHRLPILCQLLYHDFPTVRDSILPLLLDKSSLKSIFRTLRFAGSNSRKPIVFAIVEYVMMFRGITVNDPLLHELYNNDSLDPDDSGSFYVYLQKHVDYCVQEVNIFRKVNVAPNITFFDMYKQLRLKNFRLLRYKRITSHLDCLRLSSILNIYGTDFDRLYDQGKNLLDLTERVLIPLSELLQLEPSTYEHILLKIMNYLTIVDLENLQSIKL